MAYGSSSVTSRACYNTPFYRHLSRCVAKRLTSRQDLFCGGNHRTCWLSLSPVVAWIASYASMVCCSVNPQDVFREFSKRHHSPARFCRSPAIYMLICAFRTHHLTLLDVSRKGGLHSRLATLLPTEAPGTTSRTRGVEGGTSRVPFPESAIRISRRRFCGT